MKKIEISKPGSLYRHLLMPVVLIVFFFTFYLVYENIKERTIKEFSNEQQMLAKTAAKGIESFFHVCHSDLVFLSQFREIQESTDESEALMINFFKVHRSLLSAITRVDSLGVILYTYPRNQSVIGNDISYQAHIRQILETRQEVISDVFMTAQGFPAVAYHVPIFHGDTFTGSLALLIPMDELGKLHLGEIKIRGTGKVWLESEDGIDIYSPGTQQSKRLLLEKTENDTTTIELLKKINNEDIGTSKVEKDYITYCRVPLGKTYWTIYISFQEHDIDAALKQLRNRMLLVFSLLFVIISYYFYSLSKVRKFLKEEAKRKRIEKNLLESEEKFRKIFEDHAAMKLMIDPNSGDIVNANEAAASYYGWSREELKQMKIDQINILGHEEVQKSIEKVKNLEINQFEFRHRRKDGSIRDVEVFSSRIKIGNEYLLHSIIHDISKRKQTQDALIRAKEKAEESDRLKSAFLANMSHEIRTPMNGILGFAEVLRKQRLSGEKQREYLGIIEKSGVRMLDIINNIIDISKIESGQMKVSLTVDNINRHLDELYSFFIPEAEKKGIELHYTKNLSDDEAHIRTDIDKFHAILVNLIKNAINYTLKGRIDFGYTLKGKILEFYVKDTGIGIPEDRQQAIFERFIQADIEDTMAFQGAGLGLAISKAFIDMLGSEIRVESEPGIGSSFYFTLPYNFKSKKEIGAQDMDPVEQENLQIAELKILIVEDDEASELLITEILRNYCKDILKAKTGLEAIELCRQNPDIDLVLMDIQLPEINGYKATQEIRKFNRDVIIIAQTAFALSGDREKAISKGCNDYISKPVRRERLVEIINKHLR